LPRGTPPPSRRCAARHPLPQGERVHRVLGLILFDGDRALGDHDPLQDPLDRARVDLPFPADQHELRGEPSRRGELRG
jgi:hypothetical protein